MIHSVRSVIACLFAGLCSLASLTTADAQTQNPWTSRVSASTDSLSGAAYGAGLYVVVGDGGTIVTSPDGVTWTKRTSTTTNSLRSITFGGGRFVAVGAVGTVLSSADGITWKKEASTTTAFLSGVGHGAGRFVAVGGFGAGITSTDGITWSAVDTTAGSKFLQGVTFVDGRFLTYGQEGYLEDGEPHGTVCASTDGITWTTVVLPPSSDVYAMTHFRGRYYTGGNYGECFSSADLVNWQLETTGVYVSINSMTTDGQTLVAGSYGGEIMTSKNGTVWTPAVSGVTIPLFGGLYANGRFLVVGSVASGRGTILTTPQDTVVTAFDSWRARKFTTADLADPAISGAMVDADHDGLSNLAEFAHGLDPKVADAGSGRLLSVKQPSAPFAAVELGWTYDVTATAGVGIVVRYSDTLEAGSWQTLAATPENVSKEGDLQKVMVTDTAPPAARRFYRLEYTQKD